MTDLGTSRFTNHPAFHKWLESSGVSTFGVRKCVHSHLPPYSYISSTFTDHELLNAVMRPSIIYLSNSSEKVAPVIERIDDYSTK